MDITHILVVESDKNVAGKLKTSLERSEGVIVDVATGLREALRVADECTPDFIVIDLNAAVLEGFEVTQVLRCRQSVFAKPVLMLQRCRSGHPAPDQAPIVGDVILRKKLQRVLNPSQHRQLVPWALARYDDARLTADFAVGRFWVEGVRVELRTREQELLRVIVEQANRVVTRGELQDRLWGYETRSLDVCIRHLRHKLGSASQQIETLRGFGYRFVPHGVPSRIPEPGARCDDVSTDTAWSVNGSESTALHDNKNSPHGGIDGHY